MFDIKFAEEVHDILQEIEDLLVAKNEKYGNSALEPLGVFSQLSAKEGLLVRIDDKLKRIKNGSLENDDEDVVNDLIGYLVLLKIHANREQSFDELDGSHNWGKIINDKQPIGYTGADVPNTQPFPRWQEPHTYYPNVEIPCINPNGTVPSPGFVVTTTPGSSIGTITTPNGTSTSTTHGHPIGSAWSYTSNKSHNED